MRVGFIGVGNMGGPIATHLMAAEHELQAFDLNEQSLERVVELGAQRATSASNAAEGAEVVFLSLPMPSDVEQVVSGDGGLSM